MNRRVLQIVSGTHGKLCRSISQINVLKLQLVCSSPWSSLWLQEDLCWSSSPTPHLVLFSCGVLLLLSPNLPNTLCPPAPLPQWLSFVCHWRLNVREEDHSSKWKSGRVCTRTVVLATVTLFLCHATTTSEGWRELLELHFILFTSCTQAQIITYKNSQVGKSLR